MSNQNNIEQKIAELDALIHKIESGEFELSEVSEKFEQALRLAKNIEEDLKGLKNKIFVLGEDFSESSSYES